MLNPRQRDRLVEQHLPLARGLARRHANGHESLEDLVQVGAVGLVTAARRYDPRRGVPFAAYAAPTIDGELRRHLRDRSSTIRIPRREQALATAVRRAGERAGQRLGREASLAESAAAAGVTLTEAEHAVVATTPAAPLADAESEADATDGIEACELRTVVRAALATLEPIERRAVALRFAGDLSQAEVAQRLEISQSHASRVLARALEKLRGHLESDRDVPDCPATAYTPVHGGSPQRGASRDAQRSPAPAHARGAARGARA